MKIKYALLITIPLVVSVNFNANTFSYTQKQLCRPTSNISTKNFTK